MWVYDIVKTLTGAPVERVHLSKDTWSTVANGAGTGQHSVALRNEYLRGEWTSRNEFRSYWRSLIRPLDHTIVSSWEEGGVKTACYAGMITRRPKWDGVALDVTTTEIRSLLSRRTAFSVYSYASGDWGIYDIDLRAAVWVALTKGFLGGDAQWNIPLLSTWVNAGTERRSFPRWEHKTIEEIISDLTTTDGGSDLHLRPVWGSNGRLSWEPRIGVPRLQAPTYDWHLASDGGIDWSWGDDSTGFTTGVHVLGNGSEVDMRRAGVGATEVPLGGYTGPYMDSVATYKDVEDIAQLRAFGRAQIIANRSPVQQIKLSVPADGAPTPNGFRGPTAAELVPGIRAQLISSGDLWVEDGGVTRYCVGVSKKNDSTIELDLQEAP